MTEQEELEQQVRLITEKVEKLDRIVYRIWKDLEAQGIVKPRQPAGRSDSPPLCGEFGVPYPTPGIRGRKAYSFFRPFTCCLSFLLISSLFCSTCSCSRRLISALV